MGIHDAGTSQTYTGGAADQLLHPDDETSDPGSVTESRSLAGAAADSVLHPNTTVLSSSISDDSDLEADKKLHPEKYSWYKRPWFGL
jgi:hypothetical protein